jgi:hypothetical protein
MSLETGVLIAMSIGVIGAAALTGFALWSRYQEKKDNANHQNH